MGHADRLELPASNAKWTAALFLYRKELFTTISEWGDPIEVASRQPNLKVATRCYDSK